MQFALLIYHSPEEFASRKNDYNDPYLGSWRAYYKALVEAGVYVGADALEVPEPGTTGRFIILELPSVDAASNGLRDVRAHRLARLKSAPWHLMRSGGDLRDEWQPSGGHSPDH